MFINIVVCARRIYFSLNIFIFFYVALPRRQLTFEIYSLRLMKVVVTLEYDGIALLNVYFFTLTTTTVSI